MSRGPSKTSWVWSHVAALNEKEVRCTVKCDVSGKPDSTGSTCNATIPHTKGGPTTNIASHLEKKHTLSKREVRCAMHSLALVMSDFNKLNPNNNSPRDGERDHVRGAEL